MKTKTEEKTVATFKINLEVSKRSIWSALGFILSSIIIFMSAGLFRCKFEEFYKFTKGSLSLSDVLFIITLLVIAYSLIGLSVCLWLNIFKKIKTYKEGGLIFWLILGLILGIIVGAIFFSGLAINLVYVFSICFILCSFIGFILE